MLRRLNFSSYICTRKEEVTVKGKGLYDEDEKAVVDGCRRTDESDGYDRAGTGGL